MALHGLPADVADKEDLELFSAQLAQHNNARLHPTIQGRFCRKFAGLGYLYRPREHLTVDPI